MRSSLSAPFIFALAVAALLLAGCAAPAQPLAARANKAPAPASDVSDAAAGAGRVLNAAPRVVEFHGSLDHADDGGVSVETFTATVADDNAEGDIAGLDLAASGPDPVVLSHALTAADRDRRFNPGYGPDGFAVWDAVPQDGKLQVAARYTYAHGAAPGTWTWALTVRDASGLEGLSRPDVTLVDPVHVVDVVGAVTADGRAAPADGWGGWSAAPGAQDVPSVTYLKVLNRAAGAGQRFVVDFTTRDFVGRSDAGWRVPLDGNVRFAAWEGLPGQAPREGSFTYGEVSHDGSVTLEFHRAGSVMYVGYEVAQVPTPLPSQTYHAPFSVTPL